MLNYLRSLSEHYQVLYFTCVKDNIVPSKEVITLNKKRKAETMRNRESNPGDSVDHFFLVHKATQGKAKVKII